MDDRQFGALVRAARIRRNLRQQDLAGAVGVSRSTISVIENGGLGRLNVNTLRRVSGPLQIRVEVTGWWRGGEAQRLLSRRHSRLAESFGQFLVRHEGWSFEAEVSFSILGERGIVDQLGWHQAAAHLLVVELKTEFVDINEMLGTLDRKVRLARAIAAQRDWHPRSVSVWLIVAESRTNRRHAADHSTLLGSRFNCDGRSLEAFLRRPAAPTRGLAFWTNVAGGGARREELAARRAVRRRTPV